MNVPSAKKVEQTSLEYYLEEQSSAWWSYVMGIPGLVISGIKPYLRMRIKSILIKQTIILLNLPKRQVRK